MNRRAPFDRIVPAAKMRIGVKADIPDAMQMHVRIDRNIRYGVGARDIFVVGKVSVQRGQHVLQHFGIVLLRGWHDLRVALHPMAKLLREGREGR